jgi:hypothetical protein
MKSNYLSLVLFTFMMAVPAAQAQDTPAPDITLDGLELVDKDQRGELYADPNVDWSVYTEIQLDPATVAFRKNWKRDQNRYDSFKVRPSDMEKIKVGLADLFDEVFTNELSGQGGYTMTTEAGDHVLRIEPHIVDLDVYAPDTRTAGMTRSYVDSAGRMTLKLFMYDSVTGDLIAAASDRREAPRRGYTQWATSVSNKADARRMLQFWATALRERLDQARTK